MSSVAGWDRRSAIFRAFASRSSNVSPLHILAWIRLLPGFMPTLFSRQKLVAVAKSALCTNDALVYLDQRVSKSYCTFVSTNNLKQGADERGGVRA